MTQLRLSESQKAVVAHEEGALLVVAGPGSGKTRVLTERVKRLLQQEGQHFRILCLTFTNKAANEMRDRLESVSGVADRTFIGTLHSFCTEVLANRGKSVGINGLPNIFDSFSDRRQVLQTAVESLPDLREDLDLCNDGKERAKKLDQWLREIGDCKNALVLPEMVNDDTFRRLYSEYNNQLRASNAVDFDDLLLLTYNLFEDRPAIASFYRRQYKYICIDEAQDLNEAQYRLLCALCGSDYYNIMMVGDPKQAIFMWNGAHPKYLDLFQQDFSAVRIELRENFRSARSIVEAAKVLDDRYEVEGVLAIQGVVEIAPCSDEKSEAIFVLDTIAKLIEQGHPDIEGPVTLGRCAIIGRNRFVFREIQEALRERGVAFSRKVGSSGVQSESDLIAAFEMTLRLLANPLDRLHLALLLQKWDIALSVEDVYEGTDLRALTGEDLLKSIQNQAPAIAAVVFQALEALQWETQGLRLSSALDVFLSAAQSFDQQERALIEEDLIEWRRQWDYYVRNERGGAQSLPGFLSQVALGTTQQPSQDGISLLTVHSAKGMEFDVVFLISMADGTFPDFRATGPALEEERRNAFVAITRSRRLLYISYPQEKLMPWGDLRRQNPSRFITELAQV